MMRALVAGTFALALGATILAGDGLVLVPHSHAPGQPADHPHGLALYRFPIALLGAPPDVAATTGDRVSGPSFRLARPLAGTLVGAALTLLGAVVAVGALRPAAHPIGRIPRPFVGPRQWWSITPTGPPRPAPLPL